MRFLYLATLVVGITLSPAWGTDILQNSTVVFSDNYNTTVGGGNDTLGANPIPDVGPAYPNPPAPDGPYFKNVTVTNAGAQGVQEGDACLKMLHDGTADGAATLISNFDPITAGNTVTWRSRVYFTGGGNDDDYQFFFGGPAGWSVLTTIRGGYVNAYNGTAYVPTATKIVTDKWTTWEISYQVGNPTFSWLVDGVGDTTATVYNSTRDVGKVQFFGNWSSSWGGGYPVYLDAVPEPASLALLALGGLGLVARRRRA